MSVQPYGSPFFCAINDPNSKEVGVGQGGDREKYRKHVYSVSFEGERRKLEAEGGGLGD